MLLGLPPPISPERSHLFFRCVIFDPFAPWGEKLIYRSSARALRRSAAVLTRDDLWRAEGKIRTNPPIFVRTKMQLGKCGNLNLLSLFQLTFVSFKTSHESISAAKGSTT